MSKLKSFLVRIDPDLHKRLKFHSIETGTPMYEIISDLIEKHLEENQ